MTPDLVRDSVLEKCGFKPRMDNTQTYSVENSDLCLTGAQFRARENSQVDAAASVGSDVSL